ncbi:DUF6248 family natural product biosynthesis protein [Streptosporangium sp. NBC_01810]|uniref:DUF6248 family natural product biosynthesis protein n=1 Tax=Streptosporangium sp. NBC_01810 TaxID=2975951 RepID=UPI002DDAF833|nr:DUF6248 family natural product biosynthesis protein [Streptosporangium sp. NBC_01810]WSA27437.1 DUF6248 family natural product biosynthesis protein [Streptosporangium sp. NBC_01810]
MTPDQAEWVRANIWTKPMRKQHRDVPLTASTCACQSGLTHWCQPDIGQHDRCRRATPLPTWETLICDRSGVYPAHHAEPHQHPTPSITGPRYGCRAQVYLADRICQWICPCAHHANTRPLAAPEPETVPRTSWTYELVELPLFDLAT